MKLLLPLLLFVSQLHAATIVELASATTELSTLVQVLSLPAYSGVLSALTGTGPFTVFAPTNVAFTAAGVDVTDVEAVTQVLKYHVLSGKVPSSALRPVQFPSTLAGQPLTVRKSISGVTVNDARVINPDVMATNGIVHVINKVLTPPKSIVETAIGNPSLSTLVSVLSSKPYSAILSALSNTGSFTVFAPTNAAFEAAGIDTKDVAAVSAVLKYHVINGGVRSTDLSATQQVSTLQGQKLTISSTLGGVTVNKANVIAADVLASNGVVHVINRVLIPPSIVDLAVATPSLSTLVSVLSPDILNLLSSKGPFTVFAPTNAAFEAAGVDVTDVAALKEVMKYHVINGDVLSSSLASSQSVSTLQGQDIIITKNSGVLMVNTGKVVGADVLAMNGVVHVIDKVLLPPTKNIVKLAVDTPILSTLVSVLTDSRYSAVLKALSGVGPFTVFAPTDAAFQAAGINKNDVSAVTKVLQYHVINGAVLSTALSTVQRVPTLEGQQVSVSKDTVSGGVSVNNAKVVIADVLATNGVVHVIGKVLTLPSKDIVQLAVGTPTLSTLVSVLTMKAYSGILKVLQGKGPLTVFAPTDAAFTAAGVDVNDVDTVSKVLKYHVINGGVFSTMLSSRQAVATLQGQKVQVTKSNGRVKVNDANVVIADAIATNGVVHVIDSVLLPPNNKMTHDEVVSTIQAAISKGAPLYNQGDHKGCRDVYRAAAEAIVMSMSPGADEMAAAVRTVNRQSATNGAWTLRRAFDKIISNFSHRNEASNPLSSLWNSFFPTATKKSCEYLDTMTKHGQKYQGPSAVCTCDDGTWTNCVDQPANQKSIVELAVETDNLSTLEFILTMPEYKPVLDALSGKGPFTVFAPTNKAFAAASIDVTDVAAVTNVLKYHVVSGTIYSSALQSSQSVSTLQGQSVKVIKNNEGVFVNLATVVKADIFASNGVVHLINRVLMPQTSSSSSSASAFVSSVFGGVMSEEEVVSTIQNAISIGVPLYNRGDYQGCYNAYANAANKVVNTNSPGTDLLTPAIAQAINETPKQAAWTFRYAFDKTTDRIKANARNNNTPRNSVAVTTSTTGFSVDPTSLDWQTTNDSVMGGVSYSTVRTAGPTGNPHINFKGYATTASNGGFANVRTYGTTPYDFSNCLGLSIEVKGDGLKYGFEVYNNAYNRRSTAYEVAFFPSADWTTVEIPFTELIATRMGRANFNDKLVSKQIYSFGMKRSAFTGGYKDSTFKSGNFNVKLRNIQCMN